MWKPFLLALSLTPTLAPVTLAYQLVFVVDDTEDEIDALVGDGVCATFGGSCTLRAAVAEANAVPGPDQVLVPAGTYALDLPQSLGGGGLSIGAIGGLDLLGAGAGSTRIDGSLVETTLTIDGGSTVVADLTVVGGTAAGVVVYGGGSSPIMISDAVIEGSRGYGVRLFYERSDPISIVRTTIQDNVRALYADNALFTFDHSQMLRNGPIRLYTGSSATLRSSLVDGSQIGMDTAGLTLENSILRHSGVGTWEGSISLYRSSIEDGPGPGIVFGGGGNVRLVESAVVRNLGGGIRGGNLGSLQIFSSTVSGNSGADVGGIRMEVRGGQSEAHVVDSSIVANDGSSIGGVGVVATAGTANFQFTMTGSILGYNTAGSGPSDCGQTGSAVREISLEGGNLVGNATGCALTALPSDQIGTATAPIDPLVGPLAFNGGATETHALLAGSPAIEAGSSICFPYDQRGLPRALDGDADGVAACDSGAFELNSGDADEDGIEDFADLCPLNEDADQADADADGVGDACDNCTLIANPKLASWQLIDWNFRPRITGGQRDDDRDGYGNGCDAKFAGTPGIFVQSSDLAEFRASLGKDVRSRNCGSRSNSACAQFDLDEKGGTIGSADLAVFRSLLGKRPGPKCETCPLP